MQLLIIREMTSGMRLEHKLRHILLMLLLHGCIYLILRLLPVRDDVTLVALARGAGVAAVHHSNLV